MKTAIVLLLLTASAVTCGAQCKYQKNETDEFTGSIVKQTKMERIAPGLHVFILQVGDIIGVTFYADLDCVSPHDSKAYIKFSDGSVVTLNHYGDINCGIMTGLSVPINEHIEDFAMKSISKIRLVGNRSIDFTLTKPAFIGDTLNKCFDLSSL